MQTNGGSAAAASWSSCHSCVARRGTAPPRTAPCAASPTATPRDPAAWRPREPRPRRRPPRRVPRPGRAARGPPRCRSGAPSPSLRTRYQSGVRQPRSPRASCTISRIGWASRRAQVLASSQPPGRTTRAASRSATAGRDRWLSTKPSTAASAESAQQWQGEGISDHGGARPMPGGRRPACRRRRPPAPPARLRRRADGLPCPIRPRCRGRSGPASSDPERGAPRRARRRRGRDPRPTRWPRRRTPRAAWSWQQRTRLVHTGRPPRQLLRLVGLAPRHLDGAAEQAQGELRGPTIRRCRSRGSPARRGTARWSPPCPRGAGRS